MAALAGVGSYGIVFHTKIVRSSRRACNFMIPKGECAPAVFSIPIARSTPRQRQPMQRPTACGAVRSQTLAGMGRGFARNLVG
jgi:hypothetical protein